MMKRMQEMGAVSVKTGSRVSHAAGRVALLPLRITPLNRESILTAMDTMSGLVDRTVMSVGSLHDVPDEREWWWRETPLKRLAAIEAMRRVVYGRAATDGRRPRVFEIVNANRVDYLLVGGYAVGLHGYPRATVDLDVIGDAGRPTAGRQPQNRSGASRRNAARSCA